MQLLVGKLPRAGVLERHRLGQYAAIANAVRSGSIGDLNRALVGSQRRFIMEVKIQGLKICCCDVTRPLGCAVCCDGTGGPNWAANLMPRPGRG